MKKLGKIVNLGKNVFAVALDGVKSIGKGIFDFLFSPSSADSNTSYTINKSKKIVETRSKANNTSIINGIKNYTKKKLESLDKKLKEFENWSGKKLTQIKDWGSRKINQGKKIIRKIGGFLRGLF